MFAHKHHLVSTYWLFLHRLVHFSVYSVQIMNVMVIVTTTRSGKDQDSMHTSSMGDGDDVLPVQAAFLLGRFLPPPAPGTLVFKRADRAGAGLASHGHEAAVV